MKKLEFELSEKSIELFDKRLKKLERDFSRMATDMTNRSLKQLKATARKNIRHTTGNTNYYPTGELYNSFIIDKVDKHTGALINTDPNSAAVEFGTGMIGSRASHPLAGEENYAYNIKGHTDGWWYLDEKQNVYFHTYGQIAHRFMYDAIIDFKTSGKIEKLAKKSFKKIFGG